ncbi:MAG: CHAT domain-containing protein, partial [Bacteroidales bacterium]|nr:CHAT domain-containing protein [Bacteroidales bacterium]
MILEPGYAVPNSVELSIPVGDINDEGADAYVEGISDKTAIAKMMKPLTDMIADVKTVYFAPAGNLHLIPIENVLDDGREYIRLTSTREIALNRDKKHSKSNSTMVAAYGGLKYDMDDNELMAMDAADSDGTFRSRGLHEPIKDSKGLDRSSFEYLPGTLTEVVKIDSIASKSNKSSKLFTDVKGTEGSVKAMGGNSPAILHIATHGYFEPFNKVKSDNLTMLDDDNHRRISNEEQALTHTGLLLSGAYVAFKGEDLPDNMEDGLLTAKEIAGIDLRGCDLAVLSACSSGLGGITG